MGIFYILTAVIFARSDIYQLKSAMRKNVFSYSKTGSAWPQDIVRDTRYSTWLQDIIRASFQIIQVTRPCS